MSRTRFRYRNLTSLIVVIIIMIIIKVRIGPGLCPRTFNRADRTHIILVTSQEAKWGRGGVEGAVWEEEMQPLPRINLISATSKFSKFNVEVNAAINLDDDDFIALWATGRKPFQFQQYHSV